uniref:Uncharacterized protein n=1 Tax=Rhizophora mucronata TaxID=61149 RepID=A0A2P2PQS6_RHIMU
MTPIEKGKLSTKKEKEKRPTR